MNQVTSEHFVYFFDNLIDYPKIFNLKKKKNIVRKLSEKNYFSYFIPLNIVYSNTIIKNFNRIFANF